jgi:hypothetical protein
MFGGYPVRFADGGGMWTDFLASTIDDRGDHALHIDMRGADIVPGARPLDTRGLF